MPRMFFLRRRAHHSFINHGVEHGIELVCGKIFAQLIGL